VDGRELNKTPKIEGVAAIDAARFSTNALKADGKPAATGFDADGQLADNRMEIRAPPSIRGGVMHRLVSAGARHVCVLFESGAVLCAGDNDFGQLGNNTTTDSQILVRTRRLALDVTSLALGDAHSCALSDSGVASCWGLNERGELGVGDVLNRSRATPTDTEARFVDITAGDVHTCALDAAGALYCWGINFRKRLGLPEGALKRSPFLIEGTPAMSQISAGGAFNCGLDMSNRVVCWGEDRYAQLGVSLDPPERAEILPVPGVGRATQVSSGHDFVCALLADTTVQCWGRDHRGQLGGGLIEDMGSPAQVRVAPTSL
jgi:alpha-tubulin suppressor-like RCC1 family protein